MSDPFDDDLLTTPLFDLHQHLGARMVPFAGYRMPVQYPMGLMAEHLHTRQSAGLFDISHMGQITVRGPMAASALESLLPIDVLGLSPHQQRYGLLLNDEAGVIDDLMCVNRVSDHLLVVNGACKAKDIAFITERIGHLCEVIPMPDQALLALQGPAAAKVLARMDPSVTQLVFLKGAAANLAGIDCYLTRSGYTGEDGFEISVPAEQATALAQALLDHPEVQAIGLGARNSLRLEAGLCLYGNDLDINTTPIEANLQWAIPQVRRLGGERAGGFPGAGLVLDQLRGVAPVHKKRVCLQAQVRTPVREHTALETTDGQGIGEVTSGLLSPTLGSPIAMGYVAAEQAQLGSTLHAIVRGNAVPMTVVKGPFVPHRYVRS